ncbi:MAG: phytanoyl-CoA dioxygenase family protein [Pseudomonadota bacterium]
MNERVLTPRSIWFDAGSCSIGDFRAHVERKTSKSSVPIASELFGNIPIYDGSNIRTASVDPDSAKEVMAEWNEVLAAGPGIVVIRNTFEDLSLIDDVTEVLNAIIEDERQSGVGQGDHFATAGSNSRLWNAHEKLCVASPELFARYNANPIIDMVSQSWLGPLYQITTQVNVVRPGGQAQQCHRDYHMGFQTAENLADYPARVHNLSPYLTLQGAIAHCDMPLHSGPTKLLPYSQTYAPGYIAAQQPEFRTYFEEHCVQIALSKGDTLFFNPAVFHAAGENRSQDIERIANLMQIGSGYGRSIEIVDRVRMCVALYPALLGLVEREALSDQELHCVIAACAEGYPFPANLDLDSPLSGMAPESQQQLMLRAISERWGPADFHAALADQQGRKRSH